MLRHKNHTERIVRKGNAISVVEVEHTCIAIIVIAPTIEERIARIREVRVGTV